MLALASAKTGHFDIERCSRANVNERAHQDLRTVGIVWDAELTFEFRRSPKVDLGAVHGKHSSSTPAFELVAVRSLARLRQGVKKLTKDLRIEASASLAYIAEALTGLSVGKGSSYSCASSQKSGNRCRMPRRFPSATMNIKKVVRSSGEIIPFREKSRSFSR